MQTLNVTLTQGVYTVEMNRPASLNALSSQMMDDLAQTFIDAASQPTIKVVVLTGAGRAFSAGADLSEMGGKQKAKYGLAGMVEAIIDFPKPLMLAVNGIGVGFGATLCGLADVVYMADTARLRCPFSALGLTAELASTYTFPQLMGRQQASWALLSGEWLSAQDCVDRGLAFAVVPATELLVHVASQAEKLAALPLTSLMATKELIMAPHREHMKASVAAENAALGKLTGSPANKEAIAAFMAKREPDFSGL